MRPNPNWAASARMPSSGEATPRSTRATLGLGAGDGCGATVGADTVGLGADTAAGGAIEPAAGLLTLDACGGADNGCESSMIWILSSAGMSTRLPVKCSRQVNRLYACDVPDEPRLRYSQL